MANTQPTKAKKAQGPIRWNAVVPAAVLIALIGLYMTLFFDTHLRLLAQWGMGRALGSEVNIGALETSFVRAHMKVGEIEITDSEHPSKNSLSIGEIRFGMLWDALLRAKIVVNEAVIERIEFGKPRKSPGWVAPPEPPPVDDGKPSKLVQEANKVKDAALDKIEREQEANVFGDLAAILGGGSADAQGQKLEASLASKKMAQDLEAQIKAKQVAWNDRLKTLPKGEEFQKLGERLKAVKTKDFKSPQELQNSLQELDGIFKEADAKIKTVQSANADLNADLAKINADVKTLEAQIKTDVKTLETHFKIPRLDAKNLTKAIFRQYLDKYLVRVNAYRAMAEKYLPPNVLKKGSKDEPDPAIQPRPRARGVTYEFGRPNSYPLLWIKRTAVSSQAGASAYSGDIRGEILDLTTNQVLTGKPTVASFAGNFPAAGISGLTSKLTVDNRRAQSLIELLLGVKSYPVEGRALVGDGTGDVNIGFAKANGALDVKATLAGLRELEMTFGNRFGGIGYQISAKNPTVDELLKKIFAGIPNVTLDARLAGTLPGINLDVNSNLGPEVQAGLEREVKAKIAEARAKIEKYVQEEVGKTKAQIDAEVARLRAQVDGELKKLQAQAEAQKKQAEAQGEKAKKEAEGSARKSVEDELKKRLGL